MTPAEYEAWYHTSRGCWVAQREFRLLRRLMPMEPGATLLDLGTGTGHFARRYAAAGLVVTGLDPDQNALDYARTLGGGIDYVEGSGLSLPFADNSFDYAVAVTSLCFVDDPARALQEMWRVTRRGVVLGLLNRHSLLYRQKAGRGGYTGARWDDLTTVKRWIGGLQPRPQRLMVGSALFLPGGGWIARVIEPAIPYRTPLGGLLAMAIDRNG
ncbi:hypothetical protein BOW53_10365 [Solemya pervernicosa gill symbiont]|uniref:Methyltransferase type 11 domain-containing protein n=2 Tax=Gammaproteobacteria incertae sedis TaxID=118884 RepID=A0A1T2L3R1_9GAMM|nr:class I SAM-dependent methyltransferase [Candidatus Reidiella endopervernicosa]OOZ39714.1 hypothetical protein BOW53_10365 [Solemya pervernicosa gill symbiont]QKQ26865.1 class I SAM-dependent methyltransferase [Candidatus Reidiella endopervernicosa]